MPLDKRPTTPIKDTNTIIQDGKKVEIVSESLAKVAGAQRAYMEQCRKTVENGGSWWPGQGGKTVPVLLMRRVRAAEKVILQEEACYTSGYRR